MSRRPCNSGLDNRCRDLNGEIRQKNSSTRIDTLRRTYGEDFAAGYRGDMKLDTLLNQSGAKSLTEYMKRR
jgi:hypothetical protein